MHPMHPDRWQRIEQLFLDARDLQGDERRRLLDLHCNDPDLRAEVEALLTADDQAGAFLEDDPRRSAWRAMTEDMLLDPAPEQIGPYRILRLLGRGGMGSVYLAERHDEHLHRTVALKLIRRGLDTDDIVRRFRAERQVLARLEHPYIARLYNAGVTPDGLPYFAMEYVDGLPITDYADARNLDLDARLRLFTRVCRAVQHAHAHLVLHRDLKPGNILVDARGEPRLLDFGLAKVLSDDEAGLLTRTAAPYQRLTPSYASPEQVRGEALTIASDVYSLGVVLYELLTGALPHAITTTSPAEIERIVTQEIPKRPSQAVYERQLAASGPRRAREARRRLRGDLDALVMQALEKDPSARYGSVQELEADVGRYLRRQPITAQPYTLRYHARVLVRRVRPYLKHAAAVVIAGLLMVIAGLAYGPLDKNPVDYTWEGNNLVLLNAQGQAIERLYVDGETPSAPGRMHFTVFRPGFADVDGDGRNEVFWAQNTGARTRSTSYLFARKIGEEVPLWSLPLHFALPYPRKPGTQHTHHRSAALLADDLDGDGRPELYAAVNSVGSFPASILEIDARTGRVRQRYLHHGALHSLVAVDLNGDGIRELIAVGENNAFDEAVLAVLDPHALDGQAPPHGDYVAEGFAPARHHAYVRFPATEVSLVVLTTRRVAEDVTVSPADGLIDIQVQDGGYFRESDGFSMRLNYRVFLDYDLTVRDVNTNDSFDVVAAKLHREGHLAALPDYAYWEDWKRRIRYWTGDGWMTAAGLDSLGLTPSALATADD